MQYRFYDTDLLNRVAEMIMEDIPSHRIMREIRESHPNCSTLERIVDIAIISDVPSIIPPVLSRLIERECITTDLLYDWYLLAANKDLDIIVTLSVIPEMRDIFMENVERENVVRALMSMGRIS